MAFRDVIAGIDAFGVYFVEKLDIAEDLLHIVEESFFLLFGAGDTAETGKIVDGLFGKFFCLWLYLAWPSGKLEH